MVNNYNGNKKKQFSSVLKLGFNAIVGTSLKSIQIFYYAKVIYYVILYNLFFTIFR